MKAAAALRRLSALGHDEVLEALSQRFGLPFIAEYELWLLGRLRHAELRALAEEAQGATGALGQAVRGRLRRLQGDAAGAALLLRAALDDAPRLALAHAWLAELDLRKPDALRGLDRAVELAPELACARLYRAAALLLADRPAEAEPDLKVLRRLRPASFLGRILSGLAAERQGLRGRAASFYRAASALDPVCAASCLLESRAERDPRRSDAACEEAMDADPTYALITLSWFKPGASWRAHLKRLRAFAFKEPERAGWYYRQDDIHYAPYQFEEYADSARLLEARPKAAWASALVGRGVLRCPPDKERAAVGLRAVQDSAAWAPRSGWIRAWKGLALIKDGRHAAALEHFDEALRRQPHYHRGYAWRGALLRKLGRLEDSLRDLDRAAAIDEQYPFVFHERSLTRRALGDFMGGAQDLDCAFRLDYRYRWLFTVGREPSLPEFDRALAELDQACAAHPSSPSLLAWRGQLRLQRGDAAAALRDLAEARHLDPHHVLAHAWGGRALLQAQDAPRAAALLERARQLEPKLMILHGWLAEAYFAGGRPKPAFALLDSVIASKRQVFWAHHLRARFLLESGRPKEALADILKAEASEGRHAEGYHLEAQARLALGQLALADAAVEKALVISPNLGRAYVLRAEIHRRRGRFADVLADYRTVYERFPYLFNTQERERVRVLLKA